MRRRASLHTVLRSGTVLRGAQQQIGAAPHGATHRPPLARARIGVVGAVRRARTLVSAGYEPQKTPEGVNPAMRMAIAANEPRTAGGRGHDARGQIRRAHVRTPVTR